VSASTVLPPAPSPCGSCPYRRDVPSGVWSADQYALLPGYDRDTWAQPTRGFLCHRATGHLCAGWVGCHDMDENLALRLSLARGEISPDLYEAILAYRSPVALFTSGAQACAHGLADIANPGPAAQALAVKLLRTVPGTRPG
jgi:hypothetical protein